MLNSSCWVSIVMPVYFDRRDIFIYFFYAPISIWNYLASKIFITHIQNHLWFNIVSVQFQIVFACKTVTLPGVDE